MSIAADIKRKRKQFEREAERARAKRKLHLRLGEIFISTHTACDQFLDDDRDCLTEQQMVWVPIKRQCVKCHAALVRDYPGHGVPDIDYTTCDTHSATPLMTTAIEIVMHAFGAFCQAVDESGTHADRGCYHRDVGEPCWCGSLTLLDIGSWVWATQSMDVVAAIRDDRLAQVIDSAVRDEAQSAWHRLLARQVREVVG